MILSKKRIGVIAEILFLLLVTALIVACFIQQHWWWGIAGLPFWIYAIARIINSTEKTDKIVLEFVEAIKYNDYSKNYNTAQATGDIKNY